MNETPRLSEALYLEASGGAAVPLFAAQTALPAAWSGSFSTVRDWQTQLDLRLLQGTATGAPLGRWQVLSLPLAEKGKPEIRVAVQVDAEGAVRLTASLDDQPLQVSALTVGGVRVAVMAEHTPADPVPASPEPPALVEPSAPAEPLILPEPPVALPVPLVCAQCDAAMEVHQVGPSGDRRAVCPSCGAELDLPATHPGREETGPSSHPDSEAEGEPPDLEGFDLAELQEILREAGAPSPDTDSAEAPAAPLPEDVPAWLGAPAPEVPPEARSFLVSILRRLGFHRPDASPMQQALWAQYTNQPASPQDLLTPERIIKLAGGPLPEDQRRPCPHCDAVIPQDATKCPWCGAPLETD
jgi:hypothetical protein